MRGKTSQECCEQIYKRKNEEKKSEGYARTDGNIKRKCLVNRFTW